MICQNCNDKEALYERYIETGLGGSVKILVCQDCARKLDFLQKNKKSDTRLEHGSTKQKSCPVCGTRQDVFVRSLYAGCSRCYEVFEEEVDKISSRYHGKTAHVGKLPEKRLRNVGSKDLLSRRQIPLNGGFEHGAENARRDMFNRGGGI